MPDWATAERWACLRDMLSGNSFVCDHLSEAGEDTGCSLGIDEASRLHLLVCVSDDTADLPPDLNDITVRYAESDGLVMDVAVDGSLETFISPVFDSIIRGCLDRRQPNAVVAENLERIRRAFTRAGSEISEAKQIGLVGELMVMLHIMFPASGPRSVFQWSGPLMEKHDFVGDRVHVEVKTTTRSMDQHEISRLDQLRIQEGKQLLLASVQLEKSIGGEHTLASLRNDVLARIGNDGVAIDEFEKKMRSMGWNDRLVQSGTLLRFNLRALSVFHVTGAFPRLPDDYIPPRGVVAFSYTINISACPAMLPDEVMKLIRVE